MKKPQPKRGEVWWVNFDPSMGSEVQKSRPAIVVSNDLSNKHLDRFQVVPLTSNVERLYAGEAVVTVANTTGKVMTNQLMTVSVNRLIKKYATVSKKDLQLVEAAMRLQLGLQDS